MRQYDGEGSLKNIINFIDPPRHCVTPLPAGAERPGDGGELVTGFKFSSLGGVRHSREVGMTMFFVSLVTHAQTVIHLSLRGNGYPPAWV